MHDLLLIGELLMGSVVLVLLTIVGVVFARRRLIAHGKPLTVCALREPADRQWQVGLARYGSSELEWERSVLDIGSGQQLQPSERPEILIASAWKVDCRYRDESFEIALAQAPYSALRTWVETSPPGQNVYVA